NDERYPQDQSRPKRENGGDAYQCAEHHDGAFENKFGAECDAGNPFGLWLPDYADRYAEQDRYDEGFNIRPSGKMKFDSLDQRCGNGDDAAEKDARQQALQMIQQRMPRYRRPLRVVKPPRRIDWLLERQRDNCMRNWIHFVKLSHQCSTNK